ncbi:MAG: hypothetical protein ABEJ72_11020, partial [Candidatus Aenigmatarchaeota archaeon]
EENPRDTTLLFHEEIFREHSEVREMFRQHRARNRKKIASIVNDARDKNEISGEIDPRIFARIFAGAIRVSVLEWRSENFSYSLQEEAEKLAKELGRMF